jgi:hypothetical protein
LPTTSLQSNVQVRNQNKRISSTEAENRWLFCRHKIEERI